MTKWSLPSDLASITFSQVFDFFPHLQNQMGHPFTVCQVVKLVSHTCFLFLWSTQNTEKIRMRCFELLFHFGIYWCQLNHIIKIPQSKWNSTNSVRCHQKRAQAYLQCHCTLLLPALLRTHPCHTACQGNTETKTEDQKVATFLTSSIRDVKTWRVVPPKQVGQSMRKMWLSTDTLSPKASPCFLSLMVAACFPARSSL